MTVSVDTYFNFGTSFLYCKSNLSYIVKAVARLTVAAENKLGKVGEVVGENRLLYLLYRRLALEPKAVRAVSTVSVIPDTKVTAV